MTCDGDDRPEFVSAGHVVRVYFAGLERLMGVPGIDYERWASSGSGGGHDRMAVATLRLSRAAAVIRLAGLTAEEMAVLRLRHLSDAEWRRIASALGWDDDDAGRKRAARLGRRAMGKVGGALRGGNDG